MRAGWLISLIGHIGVALMTTLAWQTVSDIPAGAGSVVPVEIVDIAAESNVRALAEDVPDAEVAPEEAEQTREAEPASAPSPAPRERARNRTDDLDLAAATDLLNADTKTGPQRHEGDRSDRNRQGAGLGTAEVAALEDRLRTVTDRHLRRCWRSTIDARDPSLLVVTLRFAVDRDGRISGEIQAIQPRESAFMSAEQRAALNNAIRAARVCEPYPFPTDPVLRDHYNVWRVNSYRFGAEEQ